MRHNKRINQIARELTRLEKKKSLSKTDCQKESALMKELDKIENAVLRECEKTNSLLAKMSK